MFIHVQMCASIIYGLQLDCTTRQILFIFGATRGGPERMGPRPPPWVPLLKSYGSSILSTSLGSKTVNNTSSLGLGGTKT